MDATSPGEGETRAEQGEEGEQRADHRDFDSADNQSLVEMRSMRGEDILASRGATQEGDARVHDERPQDGGAEHERVAAAMASRQREDGKGEAEERAGNIAHEDAGRRPVVTEEAETGRGNGQGDPKGKRILESAERGGESHPTERRGKCHAARDAVNAVHEIIGVDESDDPQKRDDDSDDTQMQLAEQRDGDRFEISQPIDRDHRDESLHRKTDARRKR